MKCEHQLPEGVRSGICRKCGRPVAMLMPMPSTLPPDIFGGDGRLYAVSTPIPPWFAAGSPGAVEFGFGGYTSLGGELPPAPPALPMDTDTPHVVGG